MRPDRIVIGHDATAAGLRAVELMRKLYAPFNRSHERTFFMDVRSAEFTKYAANAMLATRISFMNEMANLADRLGADIEAVRHGIGADPRIGHSFLYAGAGYGGSCFPKDVQALECTARDLGQQLQILRAVQDVNDRQKRVLAEKVVAHFGPDLAGRHFALWGLAFKPNTDDMREAPSRVLLQELVRRGATVAVHDPVAMEEARRVLAQDLGEEGIGALRFDSAPMDALEGADALIIVTEWKTFRSPDFEAMKASLKQPLVFDGRNLYEPALMAEYGIEYHGIGRSVLTRK
jgi:UDPglucose 6-dehydrogenase